MSYKYLDASIGVDTMVDMSSLMKVQFQAVINEGFDIATTKFIIREEVDVGSGIYQNVDVRVNHVINNVTGLNMGDDWKTIIFKDLNHVTFPGHMYYFDNNYWLTINSEILKNIAASCVVRRCTNVLRWCDDNGSYHACPCVIDYQVKENKDYQTIKSSLVAPEGFIEIMTQFNKHSNLIYSNQRFLLGNSGFEDNNKHNWSAFKVLGGGINNLDNQRTNDNLSNAFIRLSLAKNYVNDETDDIINGIADVKKRVYTVKIDQEKITGNIGREIKLNAIVKLNDIEVTRVVTWSSDNEEVAFINSDGTLVLNSIGSCTIVCSIKENTSIYDSIPVEVSRVPSIDKHIVVIPERNYILEGEYLDYEVYLYENNIKQSDTFLFSVTSANVPFGCYNFSILGDNSFRVKNIQKWLTNDLIVTAISGIYLEDVHILLRGKW